MMGVMRINAGIVRLFMMGVLRNGDSLGIVCLLFVQGCVRYANGGVVRGFGFGCFYVIWCGSVVFKYFELLM
jgi:hypothetical protein